MLLTRIKQYVVFVFLRVTFLHSFYCACVLQRLKDIHITCISSYILLNKTDLSAVLIDLVK